MNKEEQHDIVDFEKIEPKSVQIEQKLTEGSGAGQSGMKKTYRVTYSLPIPVSETWQYMFQRPGPMSGIMHRVDFEFSEDGTEVSTVVEREPGPELLRALKQYVKRANERWQGHKEAIAHEPSEEEKILRKLKEPR